MTLDRYHQKRNLQRSQEPSGSTAPVRKETAASARSFVVQKHHARQLHYDFRLELDGVLKSWAVPKGPSLDPTQKRLAVAVEDHPLAYAQFEGTIPEGEYGAGTVLVWDRGTWSCQGDAHQALRDGILKFELHGEKLRGRWMLLRLQPREGEKQISWLLVKERDSFARRWSDEDILATAPRSVLSGRTLLEISAQAHSSSAATAADLSPAPLPVAEQAEDDTVVTLQSVPGAIQADMPRSVQVQLATPSERVPANEEWLHEIKWDGYRLLCYRDAQRVILFSRNHQDWTARLPRLAEQAHRLRCSSAILDGELIAVQPDGQSHFQSLQQALRPGSRVPLVYYVFDLLYWNGWDLRGAPLLERKRCLAKLLANGAHRSIVYLDHVLGHGETFLKECQQLGLEGIVSKRASSRYRAGRSHDWRKLKFREETDLVIGGYLPRKDRQAGVGALLLGYFLDSGKLQYAGRVGSGLSDEQVQTLADQLDQERIKQSPFVGYSKQTGDLQPVWVQPTRIAHVRFQNWTDDVRLRHATLLGLREDIPATSITRASIERDREGLASGTDHEQPSNIPSSLHVVPQPAQVTQPLEPTQPNTVRPRVWSPSELKSLATIQLSHPEKILFPDVGLTKLDLARYLLDLSGWLMPHIIDRPLSLLRCGDGVEGESFFQKHAGMSLPPQVSVSTFPDSDEDFFYVDDLAGLVSLAQINAIELHTWGARRDRLDQPDLLIFDLDPGPDVAWPRMIEGAQVIRHSLQELGIDPFLKTSGKKGLHLVIPLRRRWTWHEITPFARNLAKIWAKQTPDLFTAQSTKASRKGKIYIDYARNTRGATTVTAYSPRARSDAAISMPIAWEDLPLLGHAAHFQMQNALAWVNQRPADPWSNWSSERRSITQSMLKQVEQPRRRT